MVLRLHRVVYDIVPCRQQRCSNANRRNERYLTHFAVTHLVFVSCFRQQSLLNRELEQTSKFPEFSKSAYVLLQNDSVVPGPYPDDARSEETGPSLGRTFQSHACGVTPRCDRGLAGFISAPSGLSSTCVTPFRAAWTESATGSAPVRRLDKSLIPSRIPPPHPNVAARSARAHRRRAGNPHRKRTPRGVRASAGTRSYSS